MKKQRNRIDWLNHGLEFFVVIIGILLAFQLNKCSSENQKNKTITTHLEQIVQEAKINKASLESALEVGQLNMVKMDTILALLNRGEDYDRVNRLSFELLNLGGTYFRKNAYQNLVESGDIRFIKDFTTKQQVINLYEYYKWVESFDQISRSLYMSDFYPYVKNNFDLIAAQTQEADVYQSKLYKNIIASYKRTSANRVQKYQECIDEIDKYLEKNNQ